MFGRPLPTRLDLIRDSGSQTPEKDEISLKKLQKALQFGCVLFAGAYNGLLEVLYVQWEV